MRVLMVASEAAPFAKTGGLGDVAGTLPQALRRLGVDVAVVLPRYRGIPLVNARKVYEGLRVWMHDGYFVCDIFALVHQGVTYYLLDCPGLYNRDGIYGYPDDHIRFAVLSLGAIGVARHLFRPDIFHCHDWHAALTPLYLKSFFPGDPTFTGVKSLFTVHNVYDARLSRGQLWDVGLDDRYYRSDLLEFYGGVSLLKAGLVYADRLSTVSPSYAREIQTPEYGNGFEGLLRARGVTGIVNGVDYEEWNPETDRHLPAHFSAADRTGKQACKAALLEEFGFPAEVIDRPLVGIVARLVDQKGFELIREAFHEFCALDMTCIVLGSGEHRYETMFWHMEQYHREKIRAYLGYSNALAHRIEAGADLFLMPSKYEPCGLNQIYSLRYGTLPVVRATGGLNDTVDAETGFKFWGYTPREMILALEYALNTFRDRERFETMVTAAMTRDYSWPRQAEEYTRLYDSL